MRHYYLPLPVLRRALQLTETQIVRFWTVRRTHDVISGCRPKANHLQTSQYSSAARKQSNCKRVHWRIISYRTVLYDGKCRHELIISAINSWQQFNEMWVRLQVAIAWWFLRLNFDLHRMRAILVSLDGSISTRHPLPPVWESDSPRSNHGVAIQNRMSSGSLANVAYDLLAKIDDSVQIWFPVRHKLITCTPATLCEAGIVLMASCISLSVCVSVSLCVYVRAKKLKNLLNLYWCTLAWTCAPVNLKSD